MFVWQIKHLDLAVFAIATSFKPTVIFPVAAAGATTTSPGGAARARSGSTSGGATITGGATTSGKASRAPAESAEDASEPALVQDCSSTS